ncbi:hypothetical protein D3C81_1845990 [compost metagenome]
MPAQGARRAVHLPCQAFQPRRGIQLLRKQLTDPPQPGLTAGELKVQAPAALAHGLVGNRVGQRQGRIQPAPLEGKGIVLGGETDGALECTGIARVIAGPWVLEAGGQQW